MLHDPVPRTVCLRLVGGRSEGQWVTIEDRPQLAFSITPPQWTSVPMVATGDVEWDGDRCAEVWVPATQLERWRAEFSDAD